MKAELTRNAPDMRKSFLQRQSGVKFSKPIYNMYGLSTLGQDVDTQSDNLDDFGSRLPAVVFQRYVRGLSRVGLVYLS